MSTSISLLDRARSDSESEAWRELSEIYTPLLHSWLSRYSLQETDRDDLVQEVMLAVARGLPQFEHSGQVGAFRRWLKIILVHRLQNAWRSRPRRPEARGGTSFLEELTELKDDASELSELWNLEHDRSVLGRLLLKIRPRFQETTWNAFQQVMFEGRKATDVAVELGVSLKAVHLAKSRVLRALRTEATGLISNDGPGSISERS